MSQCKVQLPPDDAIQRFINKTKDDRPFYIADLSDIIHKYRYWRNKLPRVEVFYSVKCNPDATLLSLMNSLGAGFDCASKGEIERVLSAGALNCHIIYANTFKPISSLLYAQTEEVNLMTLDTKDELLKIKRFFPSARLVIRIKTLNHEAGFQLDEKFGCTMVETLALLREAKDLHLNVVGVSFHVGSLCMQPSAYSQAIEMARGVFDAAESQGLYLTLLDIGGGFPGASETYGLFDEMCTFINRSLEKHFPKDCGVRVIAEPGCYMVCSAFTLYTTVIGKRMVQEEDKNGGDKSEKKINYYLNDSCFGSFSSCMAQYYLFHGFRAKPLLNKSEFSCRRMIRSKLWGATCTNFDCIYDNCTLPEMEVGELLVFHNMGAYSLSLATKFNGFPDLEVHYTVSHQTLHSKELAPFSEFCCELGSQRLKTLLKILKDVDGQTPLQCTEK